MKRDSILRTDIQTEREQSYYSQQQEERRIRFAKISLSGAALLVLLTAAYYLSKLIPAF